MHSQTLSGDRFAIDYSLGGNEILARQIAERLCTDQTIEAPLSLLRACPIPAGLLGRLEHFGQAEASRFLATISFPIELFGDSCSQVLHTLFGTASLTPAIQVTHLHLPTALPDGWVGPRIGLAGIRRLSQIGDRPLVCAVLKPLGLSPEALADLARAFALGGVDLIKDDQGLGDHVFCPFKERVLRCVAAIRDAGHSTGRRCLYFPHIVGSLDRLRDHAAYARQAGANGIPLSPGLIGYEALHDLSRRTSDATPIITHPAFLGTYAITRDSGLAPKILYGQLPRLAGADITVYPSYGLNFPLSREDCADIASACTASWGSLPPMFPTAAGRMGRDRIQEMCELYGREFVFILGSQIRDSSEGLIASCEHFMKHLSTISAAR